MGGPMKHLVVICLAVVMAGGALAVPVQAGGAGRDVLVFEPVPAYEVPAHEVRYQGYEHVQAPALNGQLSLGGLNGGVGNTYGSVCCSSGGGFVIVTGSTRRAGGAADGDIAFRQARDAAFGRSLGGAAVDRAFRFRANRIQRSGF